MRNFRRVVPLIVLVLAQSVAVTQVMEAEKMMQNQKDDDIYAISQLKTTLSKLYPIEHWAASATPDLRNPFAPRFCWKFFRPDPDMLVRLGEVIRSYRGAVNWAFAAPEGNTPLCLVAAKPGSGQYAGYPPLNPLGGPLTKMEVEPMATQDLIARALADIPNLCSHLERHLKLEDMPAKSFDPGLLAPPTAPSLETAPIDFVERGMHVAWIVRPDTTAGPGARRMLHFSVTDDEWRRIRAEMLNISSGLSATPRTESEVFPLLSRIEEFESVYFRRSEVGSLRDECLRARASTSDSLAIRGLDKLVLICNWAERVNGEILLSGP
jgi:hypothetical protein